MHADLLFSGVRELVLPAAVVGLLDARVGPKAFDSCNEVKVKPTDLLDVHLLDDHGVRLKNKGKGEKGELKQDKGQWGGAVREQGKQKSCCQDFGHIRNPSFVKKYCLQCIGNNDLI